MIGYLLVYLSLVSGSVFLSLFNKKFQNIVPVTAGSIIVFLYLFYILNILRAGFILLIIAIVFLYGYFIYQFCRSKNKKAILNNIFTPGFCVFTICFIVIYFITKDSVVLLWDELRLWAAYPKILYYDGGIQLGEHSKLLSSMQSYEPGMPLFQFFVSSVSLRFLESDLFFAYALFGLCLICPLTNKLTWKKWYFIPVMAFLFVFLPLCFSNNNFDGLVYYHTLFIEPVLGIYFAYNLYLAFQKDKDKVDLFGFVIAASGLTLMKDTGVVFAIFASLAYIINNYKKQNKKINVSWLPLVSSLAIFVSWKLVQNLYGNVNMYSEKVSISFESMQAIFGDFINALFTQNISTSTKAVFDQFLIFPVVILILVGLFIVFIKMHQKEDRKSYRVIFYIYLSCSATYMIGLLILYMISLHTVVCLPRYSSVIFIGGFFTLFYFVFDEFFENKLNIAYPVCGAIILLFIVPIKPPLETNRLIDGYIKESIIYSDKLSNNINDYSKDNYALVFTDETKAELDAVIYQHRIYFDLIDEGYGFDGERYLGDVNLKEEIQSKEYVYFILVKDSDAEEFSDYLNTKITQSTLFKVVKNQDTLHLEDVDDSTKIVIFN